MKHASYEIAMSRDSAWAPRECPSLSPEPGPTTPNRSARSIAPSTSGHVHRHGRGLRPVHQRETGRRGAQGSAWFTGENLDRNLRIADAVQAIAAEAGATPAQIAIAWLLTK